MRAKIHPGSRLSFAYKLPPLHRPQLNFQKFFPVSLPTSILWLQNFFCCLIIRFLSSFWLLIASILDSHSFSEQIFIDFFQMVLVILSVPSQGSETIYVYAVLYCRKDRTFHLKRLGNIQQLKPNRVAQGNLTPKLPHHRPYGSVSGDSEE
jgi:hypothetical protein